MAKGTKPGTPKKSPATTASSPGQFATEWIALERLHFNPDNPRFAEHTSQTNEAEILDKIVKLFGVTDVISSLAANGYMSTEPLVGVRVNGKGGNVKILEGNRRLAALLILAGDPRGAKYVKVRQSHPCAPGTSINPVPVVVYEPGTEPKHLMPYLGVRHIVGSRAWDSYAKAAWVAQMLKDGDVDSIEAIESMTGDTRGTVSRLLEGYYVVRQLQEQKIFNPSDSYKKGRGSAVDFPFSWVYNALGYSNVKAWIGTEGAKIRENPVPKRFLEQAGELMGFMFGRKSAKVPPAIAESREIGGLAECLGDLKKVAQLRNGKTVENVLWSSKSGLDRVVQSLAKANDAISDALGSVDELTILELDRVENDAKTVRTKSKSLYDKLLDRKKVDDE